VLCRDYYNSIKSQGSTKKEHLGSNLTNTNSSFDRIAHQKKIRNWFMQPDKFSQAILREQQKFPDMCIFHMSKTHQTHDCHVKKECDKLRAAKSPLGTSNPGGTQSVTGQLRHVTDQTDVEDELFEDVSDSVTDVPINDTNQEVLHYFSRMTNHYLRLVRNISTACPRHNTRFPIIADSGANLHLFKEKEFFTSLRPAHGQVILGDGSTTLDIHGIGHSLHSSCEDGLSIIFPNFTTKAILGTHDIYLNALSLSTRIATETTTPPDTDTFCRNLKH